MTTLPKDSDNNPIPALRLNPNGAHQVNATSTSARNTNPFGDKTRIVSLYTSEPVFIKFGDDSVIATTNDHYFPGGLYYDFAIGGDKTFHNTHVAILAESLDTLVHISEKE